MKAIFLDKDGTLVRNIPYNIRPEKIELMSGAARAIAALSGAGFSIFVVTNQPGVALGYFTIEQLELSFRRLKAMISRCGGQLKQIYYCPHLPGGSVELYSRPCECRKPMPGLLLQAAFEHSVDLASSWMIGDILDDIEAGNSAGCKTILIDNGGETEWKVTGTRWPHGIVANLSEAARSILEPGRQERVDERR